MRNQGKKRRYESIHTIEARAGASVTANGTPVGGGSFGGGIVDEVAISFATALECMI